MAFLGQQNVGGAQKPFVGGYVNVGGVLKKIVGGYQNVGGVLVPLLADNGITVGSLAVGTIVKMNVGGTARNFIVVNQGRPSTAYDASCDGTWLLMEDIYAKNTIVPQDNIHNDYANTDGFAYLNSTFYNQLDSGVKGIVKTVKIPYIKGSGGGAVVTGSSGLSTKIFDLSATEVGLTSNQVDTMGATLSYFNGAANSKRIAKYNGSSDSWITRSAFKNNTYYFGYVDKRGSFSIAYIGYSEYGLRPAMVLPSDTLVDENNNVIV